MKPALRALGAAVLAALVAAPGARAEIIEQPVVAAGLDRPTNIVHAGDGTGRTFVSEQAGRIRRYDDGAATPWTGGTVFLDIAALVNDAGEQGLLGLAFHPQYESNGFFYVHYTENDGAHNVVVRYHVPTGSPDVANPLSATVILSITHNTAGNHNGGRIEFGPDGYLYIAVGDGGNTPTLAQDLNSLLGKILRIDVDAAAPYIPPTNPYAGQAGKRGEIWASGVRNPWRLSFDRANGDLFIGDVGAGAREEVDYQPAGVAGGRNYGWPVMEGTQCLSADPSCTNGVFTPPILEYDHSQGCSITGGVRVRSPKLTSVLGKFVYADYCTGRMWAGTEGTGGAWTAVPIHEFGTNIGSFGEDEAGDVYVALHSAGAVHRLTETLPVLAVADAAVTEGNSGTQPAVFQATLSVASGQPVTVAYATMAGSATAADFIPASGTLTIPAGSTAASIVVSVIGDTRDEPNEAFLLVLGPASGATLSRAQAQGTILDNDGRPALWRPIETLPVAIAAQGSYRLSRNLSTTQSEGAAITINSDFVVLDLGGFKVGGGTAGTDTTAIGIYALNRRNVTVRNGNVRGFLRGVFLEGDSSQAHLVERMRVDENTLAGIHVMGRGNTVRGNQVVATGGTTTGADVDTFGIVSEGAGARVLDNDVLDTMPVGAGSSYALYVSDAGDAVIEKNRAGNATPALSAGIFAASGADVLVLGNRLTGFTSGVVFDAANGKYRANLTSGVAVPYTGGTNAGGNQ